MKIEELFVGWYDYDVDEYSSIINNSKISLDTNVLLNIYKDAGLETKGQGIVFSLPVEDMMGLNINEEATK